MLAAALAISVTARSAVDRNRTRTFRAADAGALLPLATGGPSTDAACARLTDALPVRLGDERRLKTEPASPRVAAWGAPPIVLQCGVVPPAAATAPAAQLINVNGVAWHQQLRGADVVWSTPKTLVTVALIVPKDYAGQGGFLAQLAPAVAALGR
ncbi:MAG: DUF3515 family protein [Mycobacteriales bacterium]|nr:DUF3515 domain-containing protein [Frankia sp.]